MTDLRRSPVMAVLVAVAGSSTFGDAAAMVTLMLRLYRAASPEWAITALLFAVLGPSAVLAPFAARIAARGRVWPALQAASACQAGAAVMLIFTRGTWPTLALVAVIGAGLAVTQPALMAATPALAGPDRLVWANSLTRSANWTGWTIGPLAGGALCAAGHASAALGIEAASFVIAGAGFGLLGRAARVSPAEPTPTLADDRAPRRTTAHLTTAGAVRVIRADPVLTRLIATATVASICVSMIGVAEVFFAREVLRTSSIGFASLNSAWFAGMITGTLAAPRAWGSSTRPDASVPVGIWLASAGILGAAFAPGLPVALVAYGLAGAGFGLQMTLLRSMIQRRAAGPWCGPVCAVWVAADMSGQLAGYLAGGAAMLAGARFTLGVAGIALCGAGGLAVALSRRYREIWREVTHERPEGLARGHAVEGPGVPVPADRPAAQRLP